jgi:hypothetical protein
LGRLNYQRDRAIVRANLNGRTFGKSLKLDADDPVLLEEQRERELQRQREQEARNAAEAIIAAADPKRVRELNKECRHLRRSGKIEWTTDYRLWVAEQLKADTDGLSLQ